MKNLGQTIKEKRKYKGLSREKLAEIADITPQYLTNVENLNRTPSFKVLRKIVRVPLIEALLDAVLSQQNNCKG